MAMATENTLLNIGVSWLYGGTELGGFDGVLARIRLQFSIGKMI